MKLSKKLVSEFAKVTNNTEKPKNETTVYGVITKNGDSTYVRLDGSPDDVLTPVSTTTDTQDGDRVTVLIKNHTAIVTGNVTSPSARTNDVQDISNNVQGISDNVDAVTEDNKVITGKLTEAQADIETLKTDKLSANEADLKYATITNLTATNAEVDNLKTNKLSANDADLKYATITNLTATNAEVDNLEAKHGAFETATAKNFEAVDAKIDSLDVGDLSAKYANIDFSNIGKAAMEYLYSKSGLIENVTVSEGTITGTLVGVTIKGDLIEGNTVVADKLVIKGQNGLYYKLNTDGVSIEAEQTQYNSLNGSIITAKSITATKISVDDLVAFDATIGGFNITSDALYSGVKESVGNTTRGIYLGKDGQMAVGDSQNYLKYYKTSDGSYKLEMSVGGTDLSDASKTATNFLTYDATNGVQLGNRSGGSWGSFRTQITSTAFNILDSAGSTLASYGEKLVELGKNATDAVIKLCGGKGQIEYTTLDLDGTTDDYLQVSADKLWFRGDSAVGLHSAKYSSSGNAMHRSAINLDSEHADIFSMATGVGSSRVTLTPTSASISSDGDMIISVNAVRDSHGKFVSVETGSSGIWFYKKWSNGDTELWGSYPIAGWGCSNTFGSMYRTDLITPPSFPFTIYSPNLTASYETNGYGAILWATTNTTTEGPPSYYLVRPTSVLINNGSFIFHVFGKWKNVIETDS